MSADERSRRQRGRAGTPLSQDCKIEACLVHAKTRQSCRLVWYLACSRQVMRLILQPRDGWAEFLSAIRLAKKEIDIVIFRFDRPEVAKALEAAIKRGVVVRTLIANTNRGGEKNLRKLERRFLEAGAIVARTGDEFVRYHGKVMIVDKSTLWLMCFNLTALDVERSRSFAIVTRQRADVHQALKLFEADATRQPYEPAASSLVVSPENARTILAEYIKKAKSQILIYDPKVSDPAALKLLRDHVKHGVDVRIIGRVAKGGSDIPHEKYPGKRLHARLIGNRRLRERLTHVSRIELRAVEARPGEILIDQRGGRLHVPGCRGAGKRAIG